MKKVFVLVIVGAIGGAILLWSLKPHDPETACSNNDANACLQVAKSYYIRYHKLPSPSDWDGFVVFTEKSCRLGNKEGCSLQESLDKKSSGSAVGTPYYNTQEINNKDLGPRPVDRKSALAYSNRGTIKATSENYTDAIQDFNKAIELDPENADAYSHRGAAKGQLGDSTGAMQDLNKAIELDPENADAYHRRGYINFLLKDNQGAIQDYNKSIELNPDNGKSYCLRGLARFISGDKRGALLDLSKAGELGEKVAYELINKINTGNADFLYRYFR